MTEQIFKAKPNHDDDCISEFVSPIEAKMAQALYDNLNVHGLIVGSQHRLDGYIFDFAIQLKGDDKPSILIECDGMTYHSSPEQVANDGRKNIIARENGMIILRFTGSDINNRTQFCADTVQSIVDRISATKAKAATKNPLN